MQRQQSGWAAPFDAVIVIGNGYYCLLILVAYAAVATVAIMQGKVTVVVTWVDIIVGMVVEGSLEPMNHEGDTTSQNFFVYGVVLATREQSGMFCDHYIYLSYHYIDVYNFLFRYMFCCFVMIV